MQLGIAGFVPVEPHRGYCGLRTLLSAPNPQLTYSFCYRQAFIPVWFTYQIYTFCLYENLVCQFFLRVRRMLTRGFNFFEGGERKTVKLHGCC